MFWVWFFLAAGQCALFYILARTGESLPERAREDFCANSPLAGNQWPSVGMVIPVGGSDARMEGALRSLLAQDYPRLTAVAVTRDDNEPAAHIVARVQKDFPALRHVAAGPANGCGQKNHNSLCGVAALDDTTDVLVFCDSTHRAKPDFLRHLVGPLARGESSFSTGYHMAEPADTRPATLGYALCVLLMRLLQAVSAFTQLWGGAMAMTKSAWKKYGVADLWSDNVVDDCSLSSLLRARGVKVSLCPGALLATEARAMPRAAWRAWMERQVLFLKFCMPGQWMLLGFLCLMMALPLACAALSLLGGLVGLGSGAGVLLAVFWMAGAGGALYLWRAMFDQRFPLWRWLLAFVDATCMFARVYACSLRATQLEWSSARYTVGPGGVVEKTESARTGF